MKTLLRESITHQAAKQAAFTVEISYDQRKQIGLIEIVFGELQENHAFAAWYVNKFNDDVTFCSKLAILREGIARFDWLKAHLRQGILERCPQCDKVSVECGYCETCGEG